MTVSWNPLNMPDQEVFDPNRELTITELEPSEFILGSPNTTLRVKGIGFVLNKTRINFAGHVEPTTFASDTEMTTGINSSVWGGPDTVDVYVADSGGISNTVQFTFKEPTE